MKVNLYELEKEFAPEAMDDSAALLRQTRDFRLIETERNHFLFTSASPDYQVEVVVKTGGQAVGKCDCAAFRRHDACKHALAAMIAVRDLRKKKKPGKKSDPGTRMLDEVLRKLTRNELKDIVAAYAATHDSFRIELLAGHLHRTPNPDYATLLSACAPTDKYGKVTLNRKTIKTLRTVISMLLQQAQESIQAQDAESALRLFESLVPFLYRLSGQDPKFREALQTDIRTATKWLDTLFRLPIAPRLHQRGVNLALDAVSRESYYIVPGTRSLLDIMQPFMLEAAERQQALRITAARLSAGKDDPLTWAGALVRYLSSWPELKVAQGYAETLAPWLPEVIRFFAQAGLHAETLFAWRMTDSERYPAPRLKPAIIAVWHAARATGDVALAAETAAFLVAAFQYLEALEWLISQDPAHARKVVRELHSVEPLGGDPDTEAVIVYGLVELGFPDEAWSRIRETDNFSLLQLVETKLMPTHAHHIEAWYIGLISSMRETYGGKVAREKLSHIFSHLKSTGRYESIRDKLAMTEKKDGAPAESRRIRGFVFDLDGVIVDTAIHHFEAWRSIMHQLGAEILDEDDRHTRGASRMESFNYLLDRYGVQLSEADKLAWADRKNERYLEAIAGITPDDLLPGAAEFLAGSRQAGLRLALGSASKNARGVLDRLGIADRFDAIIDGNDVTHSKPHPEVFTNACNALGLPPDAVVVFEDAAKGLDAAIAAGCHTVGIGDPAILGRADFVVSGLHAITPNDILDTIA